MCRCVCVLTEMGLSLSEPVFHGSGMLASSQGSPLPLFHPWLSNPERMPPSRRSGKPAGRAVTVHIFLSQIMSFGVCLFKSSHAPLRPSSQNSETPVKVTHPSAPRPQQKGAHYCSPCCRMSQDRRLTPVCAPRAHAQLACICPPPAGRGWRRKACLPACGGW